MCLGDLHVLWRFNKDSLKIGISKMSSAITKHEPFQASRKHRPCWRSSSPEFPYFCVNFVLPFLCCIKIHSAFIHTQFPTADSLICILQAFFWHKMHLLNFSVAFLSVPICFQTLWWWWSGGARRRIQIGPMHKEGDYWPKCVYVQQISNRNQDIMLRCWRCKLP